jgi:hypothetical protein
MFTLNSRDLRMWFSIISSRMISFQKVMVKSRQVLYPRVVPDPVALETEEQTPQTEQNEHDVLEALVTTSVMLECLSRMCLRLST